jgi:hypothetical protein
LELSQKLKGKNTEFLRFCAADNAAAPNRLTDPAKGTLAEIEGEKTQNF